MTNEELETNVGEKPQGERDAKLETKPAPPKLGRLALPKGVLIAFRKSGGAKFSSREIVVYPDGRVSFGGPDVSKEAYAHVARKLNDAQIARLRRTLDQVGFFRMQPAQGDQLPDAFAYEIVARLGARSNYVEVFDGSIPDTLTPLIQQLSALMPKE